MSKILDLTPLGRLYKINQTSNLQLPYFMAAFKKDDTIWGFGVHDIHVYRYGFDEFISLSETYIAKNMTFVENVENLIFYNEKLYYDPEGEISEGAEVCIRMIFPRFSLKCIGLKQAESGILDDGHHYLKTDKMPMQFIKTMKYWIVDVDKEHLVYKSIYDLRDDKTYDVDSYVELYTYMLHMVFRKHEDLIMLYNKIYLEGTKK